MSNVRVVSVLALLVAVAAGALAAVNAESAVTILVAGGVVLALLALRGWLAPSWLSPVYLATAAYLAIAVLGGVLYDRLSKSAGTVGLAHALSPEQASLTARLYLLAAAAIICGALVFIALRGRGRAERTAGLRIPQPGPRYRVLAYASCVVPLATLVVVEGQDLLRRDFYLDDPLQDRPALTAVLMLSAAAVLVLGYLLATADRFAARTLAVLLALSYFTVFLSMGSRRLALVPLLLALGALVARPRSWPLRFTVVTAAVMSIYLIQVSLFLRALPEQGLVPYAAHASEILSMPVDGAQPMFNLLMSFGVTGTVAWGVAPIPAHAFVVSLSPLPGGAAGWYDVAPSLRLNEFTPYSALGELGNAGWWAVMTFFFAVGVVLTYADVRVRRLLEDGRLLPALMMVGLSVLFVLLSLQYNLRSASRVLLYLIVLDLAIRAVGHVRRHRHQAVARSASPQTDSSFAGY